MKINPVSFDAVSTNMKIFEKTVYVKFVHLWLSVHVRDSIVYPLNSIDAVLDILLGKLFSERYLNEDWLN